MFEGSADEKLSSKPLLHHIVFSSREAFRDSVRTLRRVWCFQSVFASNWRRINGNHSPPQSFVRLIELQHRPVSPDIAWRQNPNSGTLLKMLAKPTQINKNLCHHSLLLYLKTVPPRDLLRDPQGGGMGGSNISKSFSRVKN